jgi:hypothetical protein
LTDGFFGRRDADRLVSFERDRVEQQGPDADIIFND